MTSSEVMQCAAILAAGILSGRKPETETSAEEAVALMKEIADLSPTTTIDLGKKVIKWIM